MVINKKKIILLNKEIYTILDQINKYLNDNIKLPLSINFNLIKNKQVLLNLGQVIEEARILIMKKYGTLNLLTQQYEFPDEKIDLVSQEINELLNYQQEVELFYNSVEDLENIELTPAQMQALIFMIDESCGE